PRSLSSTVFPYTTLFRSAATGSGGYLQPELSDSRRRTLAGSAIRSISLVSSGMARSGLVSLALQSRGADRWRLLLLEQRLLVPRSEEHTSELQSPYDLVC